MAFTRVAALSELVPGKGRQFTVNGRKIAVFRLDDTVYAVDDTCTHRGASLSEGQCHAGQVMCPWHAARFDLTSGAALCPPARPGVQAFAVQVVGDDVQVDL
jgi:3-phenylpropionate/trans-cinnamate dioxygenase ferredoxin component